MLSKVLAQGFKAIKDSGQVELQKMTLFIGRNGSGKSSLIEALQWLQESILVGLVGATSARFGVFSDLVNRRRIDGSNVHIELVLDSGPDEVRYATSINEEKASLNPIIKDETCRYRRRNRSVWEIHTVEKGVRKIIGGNPVYDRNLFGVTQVRGTKAKGAERVLEFFHRTAFLRLSPAAIASRDLPSHIAASPLIDEEGRLVASLLERLDSEQRAWVAEQLSSIISGIEGVSIRRLGAVRSLYLNERMKAKGGTQVFEIPSWLLSEGTRRLTALFTLLALRPRPQLIVIEEIENGLDPWTLEFVFSHLRDAVADGVQVILTTHSPFLLEHVSINEVILVERNKGETTYTPINTIENVVKYDGVIAPGTMYVSNFLRNKGKGNE